MCLCPTISCEFPISAPGLLHLSTLLIGTICVTFGFLTHLNSPWVRNEKYRLCQSTPEHLWKTADVDCPDIALETAFLVMTCICLVSSLIWYSAHIFCFGSSKTASLFYVVYLVLAALALIIAGSLYIKSAVLISQLPGLEYGTVVQNMGRVLMAAVRNLESVDDMKLVPQSEELTYYQEKIATGAVTIINGVLHILCAWLAVLDVKR